jgi:hypothetical protein
MQILANLRETPRGAPLGDELLVQVLGDESLGAEPVLGDSDDDREDYSGLGDLVDIQQAGNVDFATLESDAQIRTFCRLILVNPSARCAITY